MLSPFLRFRVRDPFLAAARAAHAELAPPRGECFRPPGELRAEERALFERAAGHYLAAFGAVPARAIDHGCDEPTPWPSGGVLLGGSVDLTLERADGRRELRQLELWGRPAPADPLDVADVRLAVLRLSGWAGGKLLTVCWADLAGGELRTRDVDLVAEMPGLRAWLDQRLAVIAGRTAAPVPKPGVGCATCAHIASCPVHRAA
jgi:hypothetical protein